MESYTKYLINSYISAKDLDHFNFDSKSDLSLYTDWLSELKDAAQDFEDMLEYLGLKYYKEKDTVEVNKGIHDSLVTQYDTQLITPYKKSFGNSSKVITHGEIKVIQNKPMIINYEKNKIISPLNEDIATLFTHNPSDNYELYKWAKIMAKYNQIIGVFGSVYDKNMQDKISFLKKIHDYNNDIYNEHYDIKDSNYLYVINHENTGIARKRSNNNK